MRGAWITLAAIAAVLGGAVSCSDHQTLRQVTVPGSRAIELGDGIAELLQGGGFRPGVASASGGEASLERLQREEAELERGA
jgi:hypothetical protein